MRCAFFCTLIAEQLPRWRKLLSAWSLIGAHLRSVALDDSFNSVDFHVQLGLYGAALGQ